MAGDELEGAVLLGHQYRVLLEVHRVEVSVLGGVDHLDEHVPAHLTEPPVRLSPSLSSRIMQTPPGWNTLQWKRAPPS